MDCIAASAVIASPDGAVPVQATWRLNCAQQLGNRQDNGPERLCPCLKGLESSLIRNRCKTQTTTETRLPSFDAHPTEAPLPVVGRRWLRGSSSGQKS